MTLSPWYVNVRMYTVFGARMVVSFRVARKITTTALVQVIVTSAAG